MVYCLNPQCSDPYIKDHEITACPRCSSVIVLQERYIAIKPIGQGGFGRTFLAIDNALPSKPKCVIKQFFPDLRAGGNPGTAVKLFHQEAIQLEKLGNHPNIPRLLAHVTQGEYLYLVQDYIEGQDLSHEIKKIESFSEEQIWHLLEHILPILKFIHGHRVIHRDIKPANIIRRSADQSLVLVDLGAAKHATGLALAQTGTVIGSAEYTAPEQARGKAVFASDIYSLGTTCIHLLTNVSPFNLYDDGEGRWVWQDYLQQPVSQRLSQVLNKMIALPKNHRYQTVEQIQNVLNGYSRQHDLSSNRALMGDRQANAYLNNNQTCQQVSYQEPGAAARSFTAKVSENAPIALSQRLSEVVVTSDDQIGIVEHSTEKTRESKRKTSRMLAATAALCAGVIPLAAAHYYAFNSAEKDSQTSEQLDSSPVVDKSEAVSSDADIIINSKDAVVWSPTTSEDGKLLYAFLPSGQDEAVQVWNIASGTMVNEIPVGLSNFGTSYNQHEYLLTGPDHNQLTLLDPTQAQPFETIDDLQVPERGGMLRLSSDRSFLAQITASFTENEPTGINVWNLATNKLLINSEVAGTEMGETLVKPLLSNFGQQDFYQPFSADSQQVIVTTPEGAEVWALSAARKVFSLNADAASFTPKENILISENHREVVYKGGYYSTAYDITLWDTSNKEPILELGTGSLALTNNGEQLVFYNSELKQISIFETVSGREIQTFTVPNLSTHENISQIAFNHDGTQLATVVSEFVSDSDTNTHSDWKNRLVWWNAKTGKMLGKPQAIEGDFRTSPLFRFTPDGKYLLVGGDYDGLIQIWKTP